MNVEGIGCLTLDSMCISFPFCCISEKTLHAKPGSTVLELKQNSDQEGHFQVE